MPPQNSPQPSPPPIMPPAGGQNNYHFILDPQSGPRARRFPTPDSKTGRIALIGGLLAILLIAVMVVSNILGSAGQIKTQDLVTLVVDQQELIRVSQVGITTANSAEAENLAATINAALISDQTQLVARLQAAKVKISTSELASGKNSKTDAMLHQAVQDNQFDQVFTTTIETELGHYRTAVRTAYNVSTNQTVRQLLLIENSNVATVLSGSTTT